MDKGAQFEIVPITYGEDRRSNRHHFSVVVGYRTIGSIAADYDTGKPVEAHLVQGEKRLPFRPLTAQDTVDTIAQEMYANR